MTWFNKETKENVKQIFDHFIPEECLFPECGKGVYSRGLCYSHYLCAYRLIQQEKTTWKKLEQQGKTIPPIPRKFRKASYRKNSLQQRFLEARVK